MVDLEEMQDRQGRLLGELAELGMDFARELKGRVGEVESLEQAEGLALAFHRIARTVRLTLALESRLAREQGEVARIRRIEVERRNERRAEQVRTAVWREIWAETDGREDEAEALLESLDALIEDEVLFERLASGPVEAAIARIRQDLGLPANDATAADAASPSPAVQGSG
ncbi:hypothetical protein [Phenylobacterium sp.]|uniref:hypothetical protein n=1 Tax=Phenylobacterium sp. TaxID=1871053 RepID=UPI0035B173E0